MFTWSEEWNGLTKKATFHNTHSCVKQTRLLEDGACRIPYEVLTYGNLEIGLGGYDGDALIKNSRLYTMAVQRSAGDNDEDMEPIEPTLLEEIMAKIAACDKGVVSGGVDPLDNHLYVTLTNGDCIDFGEMATGSEDKQLDDIYVDANGNLVIRYADGTEKTSSALGLPPAGVNDQNKIMQVGQNGWQFQKVVLDEDTIQVLTNLEIEQLLDNFQ